MTSLLLTRLCGSIAGTWVGSGSGRTFAVINPATGEHLAHVPDMDEQDAVRAIEAAEDAMREPSTPAQRREWLSGIADLLQKHRAEIARIITAEQGKPLKEAAGEVDYAAGFFRFFGRHLDRLASETLPEIIRGCRWTIYHRPAGVAGLITPWNFPLAMLAKKLSGAIAGGCSVIARPASKTPLTTIALWHLLHQLPNMAPRANLVMGGAGPIGKALCEHPAVRIISFTGSTDVGKLLIRQTAEGVKRVTMELGGNAPFIVFDNADLDSAADALIANKFRAGGQTCVCANRIFAHRRIHDDFVARVAERIRRLRVGNGMDEGTDIGPLVNRDGFDKVALHVRDALERGAVRVVGDDPPRPEHDWGCYYPPTLLTGITPEMLVCREETFGPVVAVARFEDESEVVARSNDTPFGLASYVFTSDAARAERVAAALRFGHVGINTGSGPTPEAPFGGMKESGFGREGGIEGLFEFTEVQTVAGA